MKIFIVKYSSMQLQNMMISLKQSEISLTVIKKAVSFIINDWCSTSISRNKEYIPESPDFLYWKFIVDTEPQGNISDNVYIQNVRAFMDFLKLRYNAVCSCDFEELL